MSGRILYLGNALLDVSTLCEDEILERYNLKADENYQEMARQDDLFKEVMLKPDVLYSPGGSAQNSARFSQWLFRSWGRGQASFVGCIGQDDIGQKLQQLLKSSSVDVIYDGHPTAPTGLTAALVFKNGTRTLCARLGAAELFNPEFMESSIVREEVQIAEILYVEGYFLSHHASVLLDLAEYAAVNLKYFALNLSATYVCEEYYDALQKCISLSNLVIGNKAEAVAFINKSRTLNTTKEPAAVIASLPGKERTVIITDASEPLTVFSNNSLNKCPVPKVDVKDTIGCGDAFVGGLLACLSFNTSLSKALECGIYCASVAATTRGCTLPDFDAEFVF